MTTWKEDTIEKGQLRLGELLGQIKTQKSHLAYLEKEYAEVLAVLDQLGWKKSVQISVKSQPILEELQGIKWQKPGLKMVWTLKPELIKLLGEKLPAEFRTHQVVELLSQPGDTLEAVQQRARGYIGFLLQEGKIVRIFQGKYARLTRPDPPERKDPVIRQTIEEGPLIEISQERRGYGQL